jgi:sigma-B regulation protein RsbU (phosphoserine phosphatase)
MSVVPITTTTSARVPRPFSAAWGIRAISRPATAFTGDFYMASEIDGALWFALGDFAGHGLRAALFMSLVQEALEETIHACSSAEPAEVVATLDATLREELPSNRFATMVVGRAFDDGSVSVVNAGHCPPLVLRGASVEPVASHGPIVGIVPRAAWKQQQLVLARGEKLFLFTDGILEARDGEDREFGLERVIAAASSIRGSVPIESVIDAAESFSGSKLVDDATVMLITRR